MCIRDSGVALGSKDVVDSVVRIGSSGEVVVTGIQTVGLGVVCVVGAQLALLHGDGRILGSAGSQHIGLGKAAQLCSCLLYTSCIRGEIVRVLYHHKTKNPQTNV